MGKKTSKSLRLSRISENTRSLREKRCRSRNEGGSWSKPETLREGGGTGKKSPDAGGKLPTKGLVYFVAYKEKVKKGRLRTDPAQSCAPYPRKI